MSKKKRKPHPTAHQKAAVDDIRRIVAENPHSASVVGVERLTEDRSFRITLKLATAELSRQDGGLRLRDFETVEVVLLRGYPFLPPLAEVNHFRFAGHPHVLQGYRLCLYLDPQREWHPEQGMLRFLNRLWRWFGDAAAGMYDPTQALYHPVGGVLHETPGTPVVVARQNFVAGSAPLSNAYLVRRSIARFDLAWDKPADGIDALTARLIKLRDPLYFAAGTTLQNLLLSVARPRLETAASRSLHHGWPPPNSMLTALARTAQRNAAGTPLYFVVAVPHTATGIHHLLTGRLPAAVADDLRDAVRAGGPLHVVEPSDLLRDPPIEWCAMSDERPQISTRRDANRPVSAFRGKRVHVWGCGGIGSWAAEFVARAGAAEISLCDNGRVTGGLLVRQNYAELHVGRNKAEALAERLREIRDDLVVTTQPGHALGQETTPWQDADVLIDATVNTAVAYGLDVLLAGAKKKPVVAQMATDVRTGTLGIMSVVSPQHTPGLSEVDRKAGVEVLAEPSLERFHTFWQEPVAGDEVVPARGCSVPTFHGSSADLAAIGATLTTLLALHLGTEQSGTHLVALPHAEGTGPGRTFVVA